MGGGALVVSFTIEPSPDGGVYVYEHGTYGPSSVLAGQARRSFVLHFAAQERAVAAYPTATVLEHSSKPWEPEDATLEELSGLPSCPPTWFDARAAGERWNADD